MAPNITDVDRGSLTYWTERGVLRLRHSRDGLAQRGGVGPRTAVAIIVSGAAVSSIQDAVTMQAVVPELPNKTSSPLGPGLTARWSATIS